MGPSPNRHERGDRRALPFPAILALPVTQSREGWAPWNLNIRGRGLSQRTSMSGCSADGMHRGANRRAMRFEKISWQSRPLLNG
jgi:hypothetical protein